MSNETIELLKNYDPNKMQWPACHQQKLDGVPVFLHRVGNEVIPFTRQGEVVSSIKHICTQAKHLIPMPGGFIVGELYDPALAFKDISGLVRQQHSQAGNLRLYVFDCDIYQKGGTWLARQKELYLHIEEICSSAHCTPGDLFIRRIPTTTVSNDEEAQSAHQALMLANPNAEGSVFHAHNKVWSPGKRCWGTQRLKEVPTIDLLVVGYEEAVSATGLALQMVGRIQAEFTSYRDGSPVTSVIGIGPGAMAHSERRSEWIKQTLGRFKPRTAEIRYMRDNTYEALRQPTFFRWRDDKASGQSQLQSAG